METLEPSFTVTRDDNRREIHWASGGIWTEEFLLEAQSKLLRCSKPFRDDRNGFRVLGDMRNAKAQPRELAEMIRGSQEASAALGVDRMVFVVSSTLAKQQIRRVSDSLEHEFFDNRSDALEWLRS